MNMKQFKINKLIAAFIGAALLFSACNKDVPDPVPVPRPAAGTGLLTMRTRHSSSSGSTPNTAMWSRKAGEISSRASPTSASLP